MASSTLRGSIATADVKEAFHALHPMAGALVAECARSTAALAQDLVKRGRTMRREMLAEVDGAGFEAKLEACSDSLRELVAYLRASAQHAGREVVERRFRHPELNSGWGVTYYVGSEPFCEIHPKAREGYAWVRLRGVDAEGVRAAGFEPSKQEGWFSIRAMGEAVRLVRWILDAHDARSTAA